MGKMRKLLMRIFSVSIATSKKFYLPRPSCRSVIASAIMPQSQSEDPAAAAAAVPLSSIVNLGRFPINQRGSPPLGEVVDAARRRYREEGTFVNEFVNEFRLPSE